MNYEELSFEEAQELLKSNPKEFEKIPIEILRKIAKESCIMRIDDSSIRIY